MGIIGSGESTPNATPVKGKDVAEKLTPIVYTGETRSEVGGKIGEYRDGGATWAHKDILLSKETVNTMKDVMHKHMLMIDDNRSGITGWVKGQDFPAGTEKLGPNSMFMTDVHYAFVGAVADALGIKVYAVDANAIAQNADKLLKSPKMQLVAKNLMDYEQLAIQLSTGQMLAQPAGFLGSESVKRAFQRDALRRKTNQPDVQGTVGLTPGDVSYSTGAYAEYVDATLGGAGDGFRIEANLAIGIPGKTRSASLDIRGASLLSGFYDSSGNFQRDKPIDIFANKIFRGLTPSAMQTGKIEGADLVALEQRLLQLAHARASMLVDTGVNSFDVLEARYNLIDHNPGGMLLRMKKLTPQTVHFASEYVGHDMATMLALTTADYSRKAAIEFRKIAQVERKNAEEEALLSQAKSAAEALSQKPIEAKRVYTDQEKADKRKDVDVAKLYHDAVVRDKEHEVKITTSQAEIDSLSAETTIWNDTFRAEAIAIDAAYFSTPNADIINLLADQSESTGFIAKQKAALKTAEKTNRNVIQGRKDTESRTNRANNLAVEREKRIFDNKTKESEKLKDRIQKTKDEKNAHEADVISLTKAISDLDTIITSSKSTIATSNAALQKNTLTPEEKAVFLKTVVDFEEKCKAAELALSPLRIRKGALDVLFNNAAASISSLESELTGLNVGSLENAWLNAKHAEEDRAEIENNEIRDAEANNKASEDVIQKSITKAEELLESKVGDGKTGKELYAELGKAQRAKTAEVTRRAATRVEYQNKINVASPGKNLSDMGAAIDNAALIQKIATGTDQLNIPLRDVDDLVAYRAKLEEQLKKMESGEGSAYELKVEELKKAQAETALALIRDMTPDSIQSPNALQKRISTANETTKNWTSDIWQVYDARFDLDNHVLERRVAIPLIFVKIYKIIGGEDIFLPAHKARLTKLMDTYNPDMLLRKMQDASPEIRTEIPSLTQAYRLSSSASNRDVRLAQLVDNKLVQTIIKSYLEDIKKGQNDILSPAEHAENKVFESVQPDFAGLTALDQHELKNVQDVAYQVIFYAVNADDFARRTKQTCNGVVLSSATDAQWKAIAINILKERRLQFGEPPLTS